MTLTREAENSIQLHMAESNVQDNREGVSLDTAEIEKMLLGVRAQYESPEDKKNRRQSIYCCSSFFDATPLGGSFPLPAKAVVTEK